MKKSKVIIPAMAMILFSTAASISGTVAWFTASRVFNADVGEFVIKQLDGSLDATLTKGIGTMLGAGHSIVVGEAASGTAADTTKPHYLIDASFNHKTGVAYKQDRDVEGTYNAYAAVDVARDEVYVPTTAANGWIYKSITENIDETEVTSRYYIAVTWSITFSYTFNTESANVGVYLDFSKDATADNKPKSRFQSAMQAGSAASTKDTQKGFRIAFKSYNDSVVWGDMANDTKDTDEDTSKIKVGDVTNYAYVNNASSTAFYTTTGDGQDFIDSNYMRGDDYTAATNAGGQTDRLDRVATIRKGYTNNTDTSATNANVGSTTVTCVAWFEGSDPNVQNGTAMRSMHAYMSFYSRLDAAA